MRIKSTTESLAAEIEAIIERLLEHTTRKAKASIPSRLLTTDSTEDEIRQAFLEISSDNKNKKTTEKPSQLESSVVTQEVQEQEGERSKESDDSSVTSINVTVDYSLVEQEFFVDETSYSQAGSEDKWFYASFLTAGDAADPYKHTAAGAQGQYSKGNTLTMDESEAQDTMQDVILETANSTTTASMNSDKLSRLNNWITFNPSMFTFYQQNSVIQSNDVNYKPPS